MSRIRRWLTAWIVGLAVLARGEIARADDESVTVVDIAPSADDLDPANLRASIASELHTRVVAPDDPLAPTAKGTLRVDVDRRSGRLTVTYVARSTPIARSIPLPDDSAAARAQAVLLAGNLARDEASELTSQLRDKPPPPPDPAAEASARERVRAREADERHAAEERRLEDTIVYYAATARRERKTLGWTLTIAGIAGETGGVYVANRASLARWYLGSLEVGPLLLAPGISLLLGRSAFESLASTILQGGGPRPAAEEWARFAEVEHSTRKGVAVVELVVGGLALAGGTYFLASNSPSLDANTRESFVSSLYVTGLIGSVAAIYFLATDGPVETALHAYERTTGQTIAPKDSLLDHLDVAVRPNGATAGFHATF